MSSTRITIKRARLSYAKLWSPEVKDGKDGPVQVYSTTLLIDKKDTATIKAIEDAVTAAKVAGKAKLEVNGKMPKLKLPLRDGDEEKPGDESYEGHYFLSANFYVNESKGKIKPQLVERKNGMFVAITDPAKLYSGCYAAAVVDFYAYDVSGKGIACGLQSVAFKEEGEPLSGSTVNVEEAFKDAFDDDDFLD